MKTLTEYIELAEDAMVGVTFAHDDLNKCIEEYANAQDQVLTLKHAIEDKKNKMITTGEILGKNAEERAANAWIAIPEYDDFVVLESNASTARANYDIAKSKLASWRTQLSFFMQMMEMLSSSPVKNRGDEFGGGADCAE